MAQQSKLDRYAQVIREIQQHGGATRQELSTSLRWTQPTTNRLVSELRGLGFIHEVTNSGAGSLGRPSDTLQLNPAHGYVLGLEFGPYPLRWAAVDATGELTHYGTAAPVPFEAKPERLDELIEHVRLSAQAAGVPWQQIRALNIALHDVVSAEGEWFTWSDPDGGSLHIRDYLQPKLGKKVFAEDFARAFAIAEQRGGGDAPDALYLFAGRHGLGAGVFANGQLFKSSFGVCAEIAHIVVKENGERCACGNLGCLATVLIHDALLRRAEALATKVPTTLNCAGLEVDEIFRAAGRGDKVANIVLTETADYLAAALVSAVNLLGTPSIVIGGDLLSAAGEPFLLQLKSTLRRLVLPSLAARLELRYSALPPYVGAYGAALQAVDAYWRNISFEEVAGGKGLGLETV